MSGQNTAELDFNAVQRGDAEMSQKLYRAVRTCVELGDDNPIVSIHDQGAGGNCNVVKEIIYPKVFFTQQSLCLLIILYVIISADKLNVPVSMDLMFLVLTFCVLL